MELPPCSLCKAVPAENKEWFVVFTKPRHEKTVEQHLRIRDIESFLPLYRKQRQWKDGSKGELDLPLFSRYTFVRIGYSSRVRVLEVPGVLSIVGGGREKVPESYICLLREGLRLHTIEPHPYFTTGIRVRIRKGVMAGMEGLLIRVKNNLRVVISLDIIMKSVIVEISVNDIEPVEQTSAQYPPLYAA